VTVRDGERVHALVSKACRLWQCSRGGADILRAMKPWRFSLLAPARAECDSIGSARVTAHSLGVEARGSSVVIRSAAQQQRFGAFCSWLRADGTVPSLDPGITVQGVGGHQLDSLAEGPGFEPR
jgi:hypothetical protein